MPSARGTCGRFRARAPTNGPSRCLIVPSGLATRSPGARDSNAQIVPTSSDTRGVIGKTVNYFCPVMKGADFFMRKPWSRYHPGTYISVMSQRRTLTVSPRKERRDGEGCGRVWAYTDYF